MLVRIILGARSIQLRRTAAAALLALPLAAAASGSGGAVSDEDYHLGKNVMHSELACDGCALARPPGSAQEARELARRLQGGDLAGELDDRERRAVLAYLKRRWEL